MLRPASGTIRYRGNDIAGLPSFRVCNLGIGQVAEGRQVFPTLTVAENLDMGAMLPRAKAAREQNREPAARRVERSPSRSCQRHTGGSKSDPRRQRGSPVQA